MNDNSHGSQASWETGLENKWGHIKVTCMQQCMQCNPLPNIKYDSLNVAPHTKQFDVYLAWPSDAVDMGHLCSECTMAE